MSFRLRLFFILVGVVLSFVFVVSISQANPPLPFVFSKSEMVKYTYLYEGERFPDGRPRVPDDIIERMKLVTIEEAWGVLDRRGYENQYEGDWMTTHLNPVLVGRAVTCNFIPLRPDIRDLVEDEAHKNGLEGRDKHWVMDSLVKNDVIVADMFGKRIGAAFMGDRLANMIYEKTGTGAVVDGGCRDLAGVLELENFYVFNRNWEPSTSSSYERSMIIGMNVPIRIGRAAVMPGDVVLGLREGVIFIPAHLAREVVETSEITRLRDEFGFIRLREGVYTAGQIDAGWTDEITKDFQNWWKSKENEILPSQRELLRKQPWY
ncbi:RraA family protein [Candidatus Latescibacterota bacterium]